MAKRRYSKIFKITGAISFILVLTTCIVAYQVLFYGCFWWECAPQRDFSVYDLNIPKEFFPANADTHDLQPLREDRVSLEAASTAHYWNNGLAIFIVRRFAKTSQAIRDYENEVQINFTKQVENVNEYSEIVTYESKIASEGNIQCGFVLEDLRCIYIARYEEFTVFFSGSIGDGEMSRDDFMRVVSYLDNRMNMLLDPESVK